MALVFRCRIERTCDLRRQQHLYRILRIKADLPLQTARLARACTVCEDSFVNRANKTD
jgi:hypothetical protein